MVPQALKSRWRRSAAAGKGPSARHLCVSCVRHGAPAILIALGLAACGDGATDPLGPPAEVVALSGELRSGIVGRTLSLSVQVFDARRRELGGVDVRFAVTSGGGDLSATDAAATSGGIANRAAAPEVEVETDAAGVATASWTLGTTAGEQTVEATVAGLDPVRFTAKTFSDAPAAIVIFSGNHQTGVLGEPLAQPLVVKVMDRYGNGTEGQTVSWSVLGGNGDLSPRFSQVDATGLASSTLTPTWIPGASAVIDVTARVLLAGSVAFSVTVQR